MSKAKKAVQQTAVVAKTSVSIPVQDLKDRFKARSIPLESDFAAIIDVADCGRRAVGLSPDVTDPVMNTGLVLDDTTGQLKVQTEPNYGIQVSNAGIGLIPEQQFVRGMIIMFQGTAAPTGWAFCDGDNGTPDLKNRFVLGAPGFGSVGKINNRSLTGDDLDKQYTAATDSKTPGITVNVQGTKLSIAQIPPHSHSIFSAGNEGSDAQCIYERLGRTPSHKKTFSGSEGSGQEHNHPATATQAGHNHSVNIVPPYYMLAFIMKL